MSRAAFRSIAVLGGLALTGVTTGAEPAHAADVRSPFPQPWEPPAGAWVGELTAPPLPYWSREAPGGRVNADRHTERGEPVFHGDRVYLGTAAGEALYALDRRSGVVEVRFPAAGNVQAAPAVSDELVVFGDSGGRVWAYQPNGRPVWTYDAGAPVLVQPTVHDGVVYVSTVDDLAIAIGASDGALVWRYQHKTDLARRTELALYAAPPPVVVGDEVLIGFSDGTLMAVDRAGGVPTWQRRIGAGRYPDIVAAPFEAPGLEGLVFVSGYYEPFAALDVREGRTVWTAPTGAAARPAVVAREGEGPMLVQPGTDGRLRAFDARTGDPIWTWDSGTSGALTEPQPTPAGILIASTDQTVELVDPITGDTRWTYRPDQGIDGVSVAPAVDGRQVVFITNAGRVISLRGPKPSRPTPRDDGMRVDLGTGRPLR